MQYQYMNPISFKRPLVHELVPWPQIFSARSAKTLAVARVLLTEQMGHPRLRSLGMYIWWKDCILLQVASYASGRMEVAPQDCLLLRHILWQRPEETEPISGHIIAQLTASGGLSQAEFVLKGALAVHLTRENCK